MGMVLDDFGNVTVEVRRESFVVHYEHFDPNYPHPEFYLTDLDNLITALLDAKRYINKQKE